MQKLILDLQILSKAARDDLNKHRFAAYPTYIRNFNLILEAARKEAQINDVTRIADVPDGELSTIGPGFGTIAEQAKLREIVDSTERLLGRLELASNKKSSAADSSLIHVSQGSVAQPQARPSVMDALDLLCSRFHSVARQLRSRHASRATLEINDEYDVQDLLHAILKLFFDDVRAEEWTPSYAGGSSRVDFLLKKERVVLEVKKTRDGLTDRVLGDQLLVDIARYEAHPDCDALICFIYDPEGRIGNPRGLETDLTKKTSSKLTVGVYVRPKSD